MRPPAVAVLLVLSFASCELVAFAQNSASCDTAAACRQLALDAAARGDFETFHDFAWLAVRKGRPNDGELMLLLARAQSLSGRPHDALVMLRRLAGMGIAADADSHDDFRRVRALPGWPEVAALIAEARDKKAETTTAAAPKPPPPVGTSSPAAPPSPPAPPAREPLTIARRSFAPVGLAYDAVSRRYIAGDRNANKLMVLDEEFRRVNDLAAAASAGFFGLTAIQIDRRRGDLWVANAKADGSETALHRLQLISGRVLEVFPLPPSRGPAVFADIAVTPGGTVFALDTLGERVFPLHGGEYQRAIAIANHAPLSIAALDDETALVATGEGLLRVDAASHGAVEVRPARRVALRGLLHIRAHGATIIGIQRDGDRYRIVRVRLDPARARALSSDVVADVAIADPTSMSIDGGTLHYLERQPDGGTTMRHISLSRSR